MYDILHLQYYLRSTNADVLYFLGGIYLLNLGNFHYIFNFLKLSTISIWIISYDFLKVIFNTPKQIVEFSLFFFRNLHFVSKSLFKKILVKLFSLEYVNYWWCIIFEI